MAQGAVRRVREARHADALRSPARLVARQRDCPEPIGCFPAAVQNAGTAAGAAVGTGAVARTVPGVIVGGGVFYGACPLERLCSPLWV